MKFKKLLISASAIAASSGVLATVLTSCAKANIDAKLRVDLDSEGKLYKPGKMEKKTFTWTDAIKNALTRSTNWAQFKSALADEIVYSWYVDRASTSKTQDDKNSTFRTNLDEWNYQINKDYDNVIQTCKNKYGANWSFYLQNEYLAPNGGSEASYKHYKLVDKVKTDFVSKVFAKNYFGYRTGDLNAVYPYTFTAASKDVYVDTLSNPENWGNLGFFARSDLSFPTPTTIPSTYAEMTDDLCKYLAKHPEGDYAAIQDYVFTRWFKTEKPFFCDAALFKYSMPTRVAGGKLDQLFNATYTGVKLPEKPNESFPFFGAGSDGSTKKAVNFYSNLDLCNYTTKYNKKDVGEVKSNGTITISVNESDDKQTCLLVYGNQMYGSLATPYAMACGNLYDQMINPKTATKCPNTMTKAQFETNVVEGYKQSTIDDFALLSNFFFVKDPRQETNPTITKVLDLNDVYGGLSGDGSKTNPYVYHCPLFSECSTYTYFYGDPHASTEAEEYPTTGSGVWYNFGKSGVRYITNAIQITDFTYESAKTDIQPWIMELNEFGIHVHTIDGFNYVKGSDDDEPENRLARLENVLKYRLMQKQVKAPSEECVSTDLLGDSGKLKTYFSDNFANIIIELAQLGDTDVAHQVFRNIASYKEEKVGENTLFLKKIFTEQGLGKTFANLKSYLNLLIDFEDTKKIFTNLDSVNTKIYSYRSKQISNSKSKEDFSKTIFENGLLAPLVYAPTSDIISTRDYTTINKIVVQDLDSTTLNKGYIAAMQEKQKAIDALITSGYIADILADAKVDGTTGFSPQITAAKNSMSNRFWYKSSIVDKVLHTFMGNKASTANQIKMNAYEYYVETNDAKNEWFGDNSKFTAATSSARWAWDTTFKKSKLLTGDKNISNYATKVADISAYYTLMNNEFNNYLDRETINNGATSDEMLNYNLFKATLLYLVGTTDTKTGHEFDNFYTLLNTKISEDEAAIVGYLAKDYDSSMTDAATPYIDDNETTVYDFNADVDNIFDKIGYAGGKESKEKDKSSKLSSAAQWTAAVKQFGNSTTARGLSGFLGLQTKANNQLDSASGLQKAVFENFAQSTNGSVKLDEATKSQTEAERPKVAQHTGCWYKFAGTKDINGKDLTWEPFTYNDGSDVTTCIADGENGWFPSGTIYAPVRKIAKKIIDTNTPDDLRTLAKSLGSAYDGYSYFSLIGDGTIPFESKEEMKMVMLKLLPSKAAEDHPSGQKFDHVHPAVCFQRVSNVEAHTDEVTPRYRFTDTNSKTSYKIVMTQINKADIIERTMDPTWDATNKVWTTKAGSPVTAEEFWILLFNLASESTVQQRVITEIVKNAFGDDKLIVYDAQLYNQFDSVWIKDWTKKTMGA